MSVEVTPPGPTVDVRPVRRALISVFDKTGLEDLVRGLHEAGVALVSTGGSAKLIESLGIPVIEVAELTGFPECLEGRVKTLHPMVHAGILADTRKPDHLAQLGDLGVQPFDLVVVNLYPFRQTVASGAAPDQIVENIDIGGPSMVRAAAKNHPSVAIVTDPTAYAMVLASVGSGGFTFEQRKLLAAQAFAHTADYDTAVASWLSSAYVDTSDGSGFPAWAGATWVKSGTLRYGENPHQRAALYGNGRDGVANAQVLHGKEMSYNNYIDTDAAVRASLDHGDQPTVAIIKHANPCGIAVGGTIEEAYAGAHACDPVSAYGGIVASNRPVTVAMARALNETFSEVVAAPDFEPEALEVLREKKNRRLLRLPAGLAANADRVEMRPISGGLLLQLADRIDAVATDDEGTVVGGDAAGLWRLVAGAAADEATLADLQFAWRAVRAVKSNAILLARDGASVGIGMGQVNRVDSCRLAVDRANGAGASDEGVNDEGASAEGVDGVGASGEGAERADGTAKRARGAVAASDAFFPFADGLQILLDAGVRAVVAPGGSVRDVEVIAAAEAAGATMYFTGTRHFAH